MQHTRKPYWQTLGSIALTTLFGLQSLRLLLPLLVFVLRDRFDWSAVQVGGVALAVFATAFLAGPLHRWLGTRRALWFTVGGVSLLRLALQLWWGDPLVDLVLAGAATALFLLFWPAYLNHARQLKTAGSVVAVGILLGFVLDVVLHGAYSTYDMGWREDWLTAVFLLFLVALQLFCLYRLPTLTADIFPQFGSLLPWLAFGPFLFLQPVVFGNVARLAVLTESVSPAAMTLWVLIGYLGGMATAVSRERRLPLMAIIALLPVVLLLLPYPTGLLATLQLLFGQVALCWLLVQVVRALMDGAGKYGRFVLTLTHGVSLLLFVALTFGFYAAYDISLPLANIRLLPIAALVVGVSGLVAVARNGERPTTLPPRLALPLVLLVLLPLGQFLRETTPTVTDDGRFPLRVVSYNIHMGFDPSGHLGLEAIAQAIERQQPDVVALQEVSRGWLVNGSADTLLWLSRRLGMPYLYRGTADSLWGNAILSRYPVEDWTAVSLPPNDLLLRRGFLWAEITPNRDQTLYLINAHLHHPPDGSAIRQRQVEQILEFAAGHTANEPLLLVGDFNAEPDTPEIELLRQAGMADALDLAGLTPVATSPSTAPTRRLDYIWLTADLRVQNAVVMSEPASDHLGVAATVENRSE